MTWDELSYPFELPVDGSNISEFALMGMDFGPFDEGEVWRGANLLKGWSIAETDRESFVLDENGSKRAIIYVKNKIHMRPIRRFNYGRHDPPDPDTSIRFCLWDAKTPHPQDRTIVFEEVHPLPSRKRHKDIHKSRGDIYFEAFEKRVKDWFAERYPHWEDPTKYWDDKDDKRKTV